MSRGSLLFAIRIGVESVLFEDATGLVGVQECQERLIHDRPVKQKMHAGNLALP